MLSTNRRSPDSYLCSFNELLASLIISSKNKSHCLNSRSQRQSRVAAVQVLSVIKIHSPPLDCPHLSHKHSKYLKGHQSAIDLIATWKMIWVHPALGWQVPNDSHGHRHLWAPHRHSHGAARPQVGTFLLSQVLLRIKDLGAEAGWAQPCLTAAFLPSWMSPLPQPYKLCTSHGKFITCLVTY